MTTWNVGDIVTRGNVPPTRKDWFIIERIDNGTYHLKVLKSEIRAIGRVYLFLSSRMDQEFINITAKK